MVHEFPLETTGLPFQMFRCTRKFSAGTTHLLSNRIFRKVLVNSKQPWWTQNLSPKPNVQSILPVWLQCDQHGLPNIARRCTLYGAIQEGVTTTTMMMMMMMMKIMMFVLACLQLSPIFPFIITESLAMIYGSIFMLSITAFEPTISRRIREKNLQKISHLLRKAQSCKKPPCATSFDWL